MIAPCEKCNKADSKISEYFKCKNPCSRAKKCYENDQKLLNYLLKDEDIIHILLEERG